MLTGDNKFRGVIFGVITSDSSIDRLLNDGNLVLIGAGNT
jgi:hypothetical protein